MEPWIPTYSGQQFDILNPKPSMIRLEDIAHSLSNQCRFTGHLPQLYSVGEHSVRVAWLVERWASDPYQVLWGLLHDAAEAYLGDLASPIKRCTGLGTEYSKLEDKILSVICETYGLPIEPPLSVIHADRVLLATEKRDLVPRHNGLWEDLPDPLPGVIRPWTSDQAKVIFTRNFNHLYIK